MTLEENWEGNYDKEVVREAIKKLKDSCTYCICKEDEVFMIKQIDDIFGVELTK